MSQKHANDRAHDPANDPACDIAHGLAPATTEGRRLIAVFASPVARELAHFAAHVGFQVVIVEPQPSGESESSSDLPSDLVSAGTRAATMAAAMPDEHTDVVFTDHDRPELGDLLADALRAETRWVGVMGSPRHTAPHIKALQERGFSDADIARVHRPIGLDIGSHSPSEIAIATVAGLLADRNGRSGGQYTASAPAPTG